MNLNDLIAYVIYAHSEGAKKPSKAVRKWDGKTPYAVHPIWCAMTILSETSLPEDFRWRGARALLLHDVLEDTTFGLPDNTPEEVRQLVELMTFESFNQETVEIWFQNNDEVKLLKIYDKVSNLLDGSWMSSEKRLTYMAFTLNLCSAVRHRYGDLNIMKIALAISSDL